MFRKSGLLLIEVDRHDFEFDRSTPAQQQQHIEQAVAILAARQTHHHFVPGFDHVELHDRLAGQSQQAFLELVILERNFSQRRVHVWSLNRIISMPTASTSS